MLQINLNHLVQKLLREEAQTDRTLNSLLSYGFKNLKLLHVFVQGFFQHNLKISHHRHVWKLRQTK
jgi:hypothetical protein